MLRKITYRNAGNAFIFLALWFAIGGLLVWSPMPDWLGIGSEMFVVWILLLFGILSTAGGLLAIAALNEAFPPGTSRAQRRRAAATATRTTTTQRSQQGQPRTSQRG